MKMIILSLSLGLIASVGTFGQDQDHIMPANTSVPNTAKYEIIQTHSKSSGVTTMRLDKSTGRVFSISGCPQKTFIGTGLCWKEMTILELPKNNNDGVPRYQIFVGGTVAKYIFLMNIASGQTWQLGVEASDRWTPLLETIILPQSFEIVR